MKPGPKPLTHKVCPACGVKKRRSAFYKKLTSISHKCKTCANAYNKARQSKYYGRYSEVQNAWRARKYKTDAAYRRKISRQKKAAYRKRVDAINEARRQRWAYDPNNPARLYFRRKDVKRCTPPWADKAALLAIYANCPRGREVDHIIPIKGLIDGRRVSGLHVPWNLQYLTKVQNRQKRNRITESDLAHIR